jgi:SAM-dependent methyltransferase
MAAREAGTFADHFSALAADYRRYRPDYPRRLWHELSQRAPGRKAAWDCGCGSGQAALGLAEFFGRVIATAASAEQIARARSHRNLTYRVAPAEASGLADADVDLVVVAQALHWFNVEAFYREARRVLVPGGLLVVGYGWLSVNPPIDRLLHYFYAGILGPWWPPERRILDQGYRTLPFPFKELPAPCLMLRAEWDFSQLCGYLETWSALKNYRSSQGRDPLAPLLPALGRLWGDPHQKRLVTWPLFLRLGRVD